MAKTVEPAESSQLSQSIMDICQEIRKEAIQPLSWFFPATNRCVSCSLITGGHPEVLACFCPLVNARLTQQTQTDA